MSIMGQTSRCCIVCLMDATRLWFALDRPTCVRNRLSAVQVVQGFSAPVGMCSSSLMLICTDALVVLSIRAPPGGVPCVEIYIPISTSHDAYKFSFLPRTIIAWNQLPSIIITAPSLEAFRSRLITSQP